MDKPDDYPMDWDEYRLEKTQRMRDPLYSAQLQEATLDQLRYARESLSSAVVALWIIAGLLVIPYWDNIKDILKPAWTWLISLI